jgi:hypothetical protein
MTGLDLSSDQGYLFLRDSTLGVSLPSPEERNISSLQNVVFYSSLEFQMTKSSDSEVWKALTY